MPSPEIIDLTEPEVIELDSDGEEVAGRPSANGSPPAQALQENGLPQQSQAKKKRRKKKRKAGGAEKTDQADWVRSVRPRCARCARFSGAGHQNSIERHIGLRVVVRTLSPAPPPAHRVGAPSALGFSSLSGCVNAAIEGSNSHLHVSALATS